MSAEVSPRELTDTIYPHAPLNHLSDIPVAFCGLRPVGETSACVNKKQPPGNRSYLYPKRVDPRPRTAYASSSGCVRIQAKTCFGALSHSHVNELAVVGISRSSLSSDSSGRREGVPTNS